MTINAAKYSRSALDIIDTPPVISVRYFYNSPLHIDDLLAPVLPPASTPSSTTSHLPRPFSDYDNDALDQAWKRLHRNLSQIRDNSHRAEASDMETQSSGSHTARKEFKSIVPRDKRAKTSIGHAEINTLSGPIRERSLSAHRPASKIQGAQEYQERQRSDSIQTEENQQDVGHHGELETDSHGLTGMPFARAPERTKSTRPHHGASPSTDLEDAGRSGSPEPAMQSAQKAVAVGVAHIHQVYIPKLTMEPIYWNPVHDIFPVMRGTWFYKDSMLPVEADIANLLERGYLELKPWTETWNDELNSATEVGALGEEKISHKLWPTTAFEGSAVVGGRSAAVSTGTGATEEETPEERRLHIIDATCAAIDASNGGSNVDNKAAGRIQSGRDAQRNLYLNSSVIYANSHDAVILRPNLAPSAYYGRRPYANYIRKGFKIGVRVCRGFDRTAFERLNRPKGFTTSSKHQNGEFPTQQTNIAANRVVVQDLNARAEKRIPHVTDLILVIHGIGQKLSERVESFHFTHAMNAFRREVNVELYDSSVRAQIRDGMGGIMVLPVNWRSTLSFEEGGYSDRETGDSHNDFSLKDITLDSIPSVRNIVSDVMLDIPYYLSHHQPKIISAVVGEANRIYRLWCKTNPEFQEGGRVHLIAHSLGSVMAVDILSKQPTIVDKSVPRLLPETAHFEFDTKNLFLCGSPVGFFLLLKKSGLIPRRGQSKPSSGGDDLTTEVAGDRDTYGCLAVDNIYNIVNPYDPVAYRLNATIDTAYAASLKAAYVPSSSSTWFSLGRPFRGRSKTSTATQSKAPPAIQRLPSSVELETHNFTREEIAEKRAYLLNDNGQIDYFLRYGGGPLEIQYLTMLGAHSSYWISQDFIRFVVIETSRSPGRDGTLEEMRAVKKASSA